LADATQRIAFGLCANIRQNADLNLLGQPIKHFGHVTQILEHPQDHGDVINAFTKARKRPLIEVANDVSRPSVDDIRWHINTRRVEIFLEVSRARSELNDTTGIRHKLSSSFGPRLPRCLEAAVIGPALVIGLLKKSAKSS